MGRRNAILLAIGVAGLVVIGLVMVASTSVWIEAPGERYSHVKRQLVFALIGLFAAGALATIDYRVWRQWWLPILVISSFLLALCYVPGVGVEVNGETRWIRMPLIGRFQPSEPAKIAMIIALAAWFSSCQTEVLKFWKGFVLPGILVVIPVGLVFFEKDMGTAAAMAGAGFVVMFAAGTRVWYLMPSAVAGLAGLYFMVKSSPNRWNRIMAFMDLDNPEHQQNFGYQQYHGLIAFGHGGIDGLGLGEGHEKHGTLPFAHTDFILPIIGEELGLWFTLGVIFCFVMITVYGIAIAMYAPDRFGRILAIGLTASIVLPAMMNIGVTTAVLPNTGLPLPFVSYGGTNLVFTLAAVGLLLSVHRQARFSKKTEMPIDRDERPSVRV
ncbi:FtsW/RodA/SpoVE family cell cycle protein [Persicirhabdus sediminis]|uniref:Probable peptidoglycan glycosyltransferase FtsW n=1 Tax=Persicirhabdus sediminis TaxID=454144 RepID=A0A8J7MA79_9BACT|nr:putative peptidoglycan glycosyltransferase FtsW [Persicirhabdus sediminis]MBK1789789.1 cell division protein FtsW [Persicirhabdus sediminis]